METTGFSKQSGRGKEGKGDPKDLGLKWPICLRICRPISQATGLQTFLIHVLSELHVSPRDTGELFVSHIQVYCIWALYTR